MAVSLKPLNEQVIFITGASSGIGRVTARHAAAAGAKVVLVARNEDALKEVVEQIKGDGGEAIYAVADVADVEQLKPAAEAAVAAFGRIDTWVNNAGVGLFTDITTTPIEDDKKLFETNFWGVVHGSRLAAQYLRDAGGALINLGSEVSDITTPTQGMYAASKHAIMGFTDAFRMEVIKSELPISVTLIKPAAIDTPFAKHAKNTTDKAATLPPPVYAPELVADQILHAAVNPVRDLYVGGGGRVMALLAEHFPTLSDWVIAKFMPSQELKDGEPADHSNEALHGSAIGGGAYEERGGLKGERMVRERSLYGIMSRHPIAVTFGVAAAAAAAAYFLLKPEEPEPTRAERFKKAFRGYAESGRDKASEYADTARETAADYAARARKAGAAYAGSLRDKVSEYADTAKEAAAGYASDARESARGYASAARDKASDYADSAADYASSHAASAHEAAKAHANDGLGQLQDAVNEHVLKPAERVLGSIRQKLDELIGR